MYWKEHVCAGDGETEPLEPESDLSLFRLNLAEEKNDWRKDDRECASFARLFWVIFSMRRELSWWQQAGGDERRVRPVVARRIQLVSRAVFWRLIPPYKIR